MGYAGKRRLAYSNALWFARQLLSLLVEHAARWKCCAGVCVFVCVCVCARVHAVYASAVWMLSQAMQDMACASAHALHMEFSAQA